MTNTLKKSFFLFLLFICMHANAQTTNSDQAIIPELDNEEITIAEEMPEFPGGPDALNKYLSSHIKYPQLAIETGIQGKVFISFVIDTAGNVQNVQVLKGIGAGCDEEAVRVVKSMPQWKPGRSNGKAVKVKFNLPVSFKLH